MEQGRLEKSCGCIVLREDEYPCRILLVQSKKGKHWSFPKGHMEQSEDEYATARREVREETGLDVEIHKGFRATTHYLTKVRIPKEVVYFLASTRSFDVTPQAAEISDCVWLSFPDALEKLTFPRDVRVLHQAMDYLKK